MRAALKYGLAPTAILLMRKKKQRHWEPYDYTLAMAIELLDRERCKKCGTEGWYAYSENSEIAFKIETHTCYSCAHIEEHEDKKADSKAKNYGVTEMVVPVHVNDEFAEKDSEPSPLPTRSDWLKEMQKKNS